jgi:hypothetical protein
MNVLVKIGHQDLLLPSSVGVEAVMKLLSKAVPVWDKSYDEPPHIEIENRPLKVEMKFVPPGTRFYQRGERASEPTVEVWPFASHINARKQKLLKG